MNVLYGLTQPDEGEILIDGKPAKFGSPKDAIAAGIGMVHQHFMLVPVFTVAENVTLGIEEADRIGLLDRRKTRRDVRDLSHRYGLDVNPDALVEDLPGRHPAAGRDRQGAGQERQRADPRRADGGADAGRDRGAVPHRAPAQRRRHVHHLHLAQAQGSPVDRRHDHRAAPRQGRRPAQPARHRGRPRVADGRPGRAAAGRQDAGAAGRGGPGRHRPDRGGRAGRPAGARAVLRGPRRGDPRDRRRPGQRADRAVRGAHGAAAHARRVRRAERPRPHARLAAGQAPGRGRLRPRRPQGRRPRRLILRGGEPYSRHVRPAALRLRHQPEPARDPRERDRADRGVRRPHRVSRPPRPARCPAATSRRSSWPGRSAASTRC